MTERTTHKRKELAHRTGAGVDVTLVWVHCDNEDATVICVCDSRDGTYFEIPAEPDVALDVYYHPYAYRDVSTIDYHDGRLAA